MANYDPSQVTASLGGVPIIGFADDTFLVLEQSEVAYEVVMGVDGQYVRIKKPGSLIWSCTMTLMQSSPHNAVLSALHQLDTRTLNGAGIVPFVMADASGTTVFSSAESWVQGFPSQTFGSSHNGKPWVVTAIKPDVVVGGN